MNIHKQDWAAIGGLIITIAAMLMPLASEGKAALSVVGLSPLVWRVVDAVKERYPNLNGDRVWDVANGLSVAIPVGFYLYLVLSGQEVFTWPGVGEAFAVGATIAMGADRLHRKANNDAQKEATDAAIVERIDRYNPHSDN